jgi:hypothetical protein
MSGDNSASSIGCLGAVCSGLALAPIVWLWGGGFETSDVLLTVGVGAGGVAVFMLANGVGTTIRRR